MTTEGATAPPEQPDQVVVADNGAPMLMAAIDALAAVDSRTFEHAANPETVRAGIAQAGPLAMAGLAANAASALVTVLVARLLDNRAYGSLVQLIGLFLVVSMPGSAVAVAVVRRVTSWGGSVDAGIVGRWAARLHARGTAAVVCFSVVVIAVRGPIDRMLSSPNSTGVAAMLVAGGVWVLLSFDRGLLQAHRDYRTLAANLLVEGGGRVVATLCLVGAGFGVAGAAVGLLLAELVTAVHARISADRAWSAGHAFGIRRLGRAGGGMSWRNGAPRPSALRSWWADAWGPRPPQCPDAGRWSIVVDLLIALPCLALIALLQNIDVIVLARDNPHASGVYAAISVMSKAVVFAAVALGGYMLPEAAIRWHRGQHALRQLTATLVLVGVPALGLLAVSVAAPRLLVTVIFSSRYAGASSSLWVLVLAMIFLSLTVVLTMYLLALGCRWIAGVLLAGAVTATVAVAMAHGVTSVTASHNLVAQAALAAVTCVGFAIAIRRRPLAR